MCNGVEDTSISFGEVSLSYESKKQQVDQTNAFLLHFLGRLAVVKCWVPVVHCCVWRNSISSTGRGRNRISGPMPSCPDNTLKKSAASE